MVPEAPTAVPVPASRKETPFRELLVPLDWGVQVVPPSVERRMVPKAPTAVPVSASTKETPFRELLVPLDWGVQVAPPSVERRMVPKSPTAVPVLASTKETPRRVVVVPLDCSVQVVPPSVVRRMVPAAPTVTTVLGSRVAAAQRWFPCGSGFCQNQPDCAKDALVPIPVMPTNKTKTLKTVFISFPSRVARGRSTPGKRKEQPSRHDSEVQRTTS